MPATIDQVAKKAGVSKATVSRVLNNSKPVRDETRLRVLMAIKELDFKPNPAARSLVSKKSRIIGVIVTDSANLFVSVLLKGIEEVAYRNGYNIFVCNSHSAPEKEIELLMMLQEKRVDGIIFLSSHLTEKTKAFFKNSLLPVAMVNVRCDESRSSICIRINNKQAAYDITTYFLKKGFTRVGIICAPFEDEYSGKDRYMGYRQALEDYSVFFDERLIRTGPLEVKDGYRLAREMLKESIELEALFVACDLMAFGAIKAILDYGLKVPGDIEVAGFDDVPMASFFYPTLTTVHQPIVEMGRLAAEKLVQLIEGQTPEKCDIVLPHSIVYRDSTSRRSSKSIPACSQ